MIQRRELERQLQKHFGNEDKTVIGPSPEERICGGCHGEKAAIGEKVTEELEFIPAEFFVREIVRVSYACPHCKEGGPPPASGRDSLRPPNCVHPSTPKGGQGMAGRRISVLDVREMLRRFRLGQGNRSVARDLGLSRNSVSTLRLHSLGVSVREIARTLQLGAGTVSGYLARAKVAGLGWPLPDGNRPVMTIHRRRRGCRRGSEELTLPALSGREPTRPFGSSGNRPYEGLELLGPVTRQLPRASSRSLGRACASRHARGVSALAVSVR